MASDCVNLYSVQAKLEPYRYISTALGYCLRLLEAYLILILVLRRKGKKAVFLLMLPVILTVTLEFTNMFTNLSFYYDAAGQFHRSSLNFVPLFFGGVYGGMIFAQTYRDYKRNGVGTFIIMYIVLTCILAIVAEILFQFRFLLDGAIAGGIFVNYLYLHVQIYKRDGLTNLLNRRSFDIFTRQNKDKKFVVISIDMNNLKIINDTYGHHEGDKAIISVVDTIHGYFKKGNTLYRMGGDEFLIISTKLSLEQIKSNLVAINHKLKEKGYSIAYGIAVHEENVDIQTVCEEADSLMYELKKAQKRGCA